MINVTEAEKNYSGLYETKIMISEKVVEKPVWYQDEIMSLNITTTMGAYGLTMGAINSACCTVTLFTDDNDFEGKYMTIYTRCADIENSAFQWIGTFKCEKPVRNLNTITVTGYDDMKYVFDDSVVNIAEEGEQSIADVMQYLCEQLDIEFYAPSTDTELYNTNINPQTLNGLTYDEAMRVVASYVGRNVFWGSYGQVNLKSYPAVSYTIAIDRCSSFSHNEAIGQYTGLSCNTGTETLTSGSGKSIYTACPLMTQAQLDSLVNKINFEYYGASVDVMDGTPFFEAGDRITVGDKSIVVMSNSMDYNGWWTNTIESYYQTEDEVANTDTISDRLESIESAIAGENWQELPLAENITVAVGGGYAKPQYRKFGDRIDVQGAVTYTADGVNAITLGVLPSGYRPKKTVSFTPYIFGTSGSGYNIAKAAVNSSGEIKAQWAYRLYPNPAFISGECDIQINFSFFVR